jgi:hypothetical protein
VNESHNIAYVRIWRAAWLAALMTAWSCSSTEMSNTRNSHDSVCDRTAVATNGHLLACAAGSPSAAGPGVPADFAGHVKTSMPISAAERAAISAANALSAARNSIGTSSLDRGFGFTGPSVRARRQP